MKNPQLFYIIWSKINTQFEVYCVMLSVGGHATVMAPAVLYTRTPFGLFSLCPLRVQPKFAKEILGGG